MRRARRLLADSPALAISIVALVFALGSGAGYAASATAGRQLAVWHKLKPASGWHGGLKYTVIDGVVYLSGAAGTSARYVGAMTTLPANLSPLGKTGQLDIPVSLGGSGQSGLIQVVHGGGIYPVVTPQQPNGADYSYVSLAGVSCSVTGSSTLSATPAARMLRAR
jgi:hypothetical protein